nr:meteorin-like protein [Dermacentor andersoni]
MKTVRYQRIARMTRVVRLLAAAVMLPVVQNAAIRRSPKESSRHMSCDWTQSGLGQSPEDVLPVYLSSCDSGTVRWSYPRGALRIVIRGPPSQREFQACFRVAADSSGALVYAETAQGSLVPGPGVRAKCVLSNRGSAVVYAVASAARTGKRAKLTLTYTTSQPVASFERLEGWEDCRPCTETELRESYCLGDLVAEATVRNATLHSDRQTIYWWLSVTRTHRGRMPDYVTRPARCGFPRDTQEPRLILARWHLGRPIVTCAPKLLQWKRLVGQDRVQCNYETNDSSHLVR